MPKIKLAGYQMPISADLDANLSKIEYGIKEASESRAQLVIFPECAVSGYPPLHHKTIEEIDILQIGLNNQRICELAAEHKIWVIAGTIIPSSDGYLNTALVINDEGEITGRHDKLHLMPLDHNYFIPGSSLDTFDILGIRMGVLVCYDIRFPEPYRILREEGAELFVTILNACGGETWKQPVMEGTFRCRAAENTAFHAAINAAGPLQMAISRICDPFGVDLACAESDADSLIYAEIETEKTAKGYYYDRRYDLFSIERKLQNK